MNMNTGLYNLYKYMKEKNHLPRHVDVSYYGEVHSYYDNDKGVWDNTYYEDLSLSYKGVNFILVKNYYDHYDVTLGYMGSDKKTFKALSCPMYFNNRYLFFNTENHDSEALTGELVDVRAPMDLVILKYE